MRALLVEDDPMIGEAVVEGMQGDGYAVDWVRDGVEAETALMHDVYDVALLDLGLPRKDGLEVLMRLRRASVELPVLIITARDAVADRIAGLDSGADDYLVKPFDLDELLARTRAVVRRRAGRGSPEELRGAHARSGQAARGVSRPAGRHRGGALRQGRMMAGRLKNRRGYEVDQGYQRGRVQRHHDWNPLDEAFVVAVRLAGTRCRQWGQESFFGPLAGWLSTARQAFTGHDGPCNGN